MGNTNSAPTVGQKRKRPNFLAIDQTLVGITIGDDEEEKKSFMLHKDLLCAHSRYFRNACEGLVAESEERAIHLPHVTESTIKLFQFWLYGQATREEPKRVIKRPKPTLHKGKEIIDLEAGPGGDHAPTGLVDGEDDAMSIEALFDTRRTPKWLDTKEFLFQTNHPYFRTFIGLSTLASTYDIPQLREDCMTLLVELQNYNRDKKGQRDLWPPYQELYAGLPSHAPLCRYLVQEAAVYRDLTKLKRSKLDELPKDFLVDMLLTTTPLKRVSRLKLKEEIRDSCHFHAHATRDAAVLCKKRQARDGAFYASFLRACMSEVYVSEESEEQWDGESETTEVVQQEMFALEGESEVCRGWDWDNEETLRVSEGEESG
ncbi:uncharacterized protein EKO05_0002967 [Ascochyta rabiei]|uniref:Uncharacterized protein n=1 Tax=Didymella rabiei TaxID=5454 RepID=A0A162X7T0_DIDRA|nr:uncharacterized protein EKO05_0002967 [Ascochyta rabiei]KZM19389.1 hypothetical protein ST47_g9483 [Ascochyta rabiei]UPX12419.1 hypothetical protein EKO05_0002967 [Ascochyta rabiei]